MKTEVWPRGGTWASHPAFSVVHSIEKMISSQTHEWELEHLGGCDPNEAFALRFSQSCPNEKWKLTFGVGSDAELANRRASMSRLCYLVLCCDTSLWSIESKLYWGLLASHPPQMARFWIRSLTSSKKLTSPRLQKWAGAIERFGPLVVRSSHACVREFVAANPLLACGQMSSPSYHERLEARLELREWAQRHLPPDVWAEIGRFDS